MRSLYWYNWLVNFYRDHSHCTQYGGDMSELLEITASIVQGSAIGPVSYVVTAADLTTTEPGNSMCKFADDTYVIVPANNVDTRSSEVNNVEAWAEANNLTLNRNKSVEIVFTTKRKRQFTPPPLLSGITCVMTMKMLGVTISDKLSVSDHVQNIVSSCAQSVHAIRTLRAHGMCQEDTQTVFRCVVVAKLTYAANAWWGFATAADRQRVEAVIRRGVRSGLCRSDILTAAELIEDMDDKLFERILGQEPHSARSAP